MRIFIAYSYNSRDEWIEKLVFPLVEAFGAQVVNGRDLQGEDLRDEVKRRITRCHGMVGFLTRRGDSSVDGKFLTHRWVTDELTFASKLGRLFVEVREQGVDQQDGMVGDRPYLKYDEGDRVGLLIQLTRTLARWHRTMRRVHVMPLKREWRDGRSFDVGTEWLRDQLNQPGFRCQYQVLDGDYPSDFRDVELQSIEGRFYFTATQLENGARLRLHITTAEGVFKSDFENVDDINLRMSLEPDSGPRRLERTTRSA